MDREEYEKAWNAALDHVDVKSVRFFEREWFSELYAPCHAFDEWYERMVVNPPEGLEDHHDYRWCR